MAVDWVVIKDVATALAATVGMALGVYNFFSARSADKVKLRVVPMASSYRGRGAKGEDFYLHNRNEYSLDHPGGPPDTLSLEVVNLSKFSVTVSEVGLKPMWPLHRLVLITPIVLDGREWPRKLEPREHVVVFFDVQNLLGLDNVGRVRTAYASTICGATCYGNSRALKQLIGILKGV